MLSTVFHRNGITKDLLGVYQLIPVSQVICILEGNKAQEESWWFSFGSL